MEGICAARFWKEGIFKSGILRKMILAKLNGKKNRISNWPIYLESRMHRRALKNGRLKTEPSPRNPITIGRRCFPDNGFLNTTGARSFYQIFALNTVPTSVAIPRNAILHHLPKYLRVGPDEEDRGDR